MAMRSGGGRELNWFERARLDAAAWLRRGLVSEAVVQDKQYKTVFICENRLTAYRAVSLWIKEAGTMAWLDAGLRPGDRFLDIGANIGIYSLAAAHRVGPTGRVYAVEPHKPNAVGLMRNVLRNGLQDRIDVLAIALSDARTVAAFNYTSLDASVTGSQLGNTFKDGRNKPFVPAAIETCVALSVDELIGAGAIAAPNLVKIDVDGTELKILKGMSGLLTGETRPRSVQVELNAGEHEAIDAFFKGVGYAMDHRHFTLDGEKRRAAGVALENIAHNAVFVPVSAAPSR
jgi:FkbM family methyltransferase